jgi:hypothetical protein
LLSSSLNQNSSLSPEPNQNSSTLFETKQNILPKLLPEKFNALQWYNADRTQLLSVKFSTIQLNANLINYTSLFPYEELNSNINNELSNKEENKNYQCCTVLNGDIVNCQTFLAQTYNPPSTPPPPPPPLFIPQFTTTTINNNNGFQKIQDLEVRFDESTPTTTSVDLNDNESEKHIGKLFNSTSSDTIVSQQDQLIKMSTNVILGQQILANNNNNQQSPQATTYPSM